MSPRVSIRLLGAQSDQRLLALARDGHERAFEALVQRYRRPLLRYARSRIRLSDARAEDVLQQSFMQSWLALSRGVVVHDVRSWLYRIVHNTAVNAMRGPEAHRELTQALEDRAGLAQGSNLERRIAVRDALGHVAALPDMQQQAIFLTAVDGQTHEEVAGTLGISIGALRGLLYRARSTLRSAAAALTPQPLLEWASRGAETAAPSAERIAEWTAGAGVAGVLAKGTAVALSVGALATGAAVEGHRSAPPFPHRVASRASPRASAAAPPGESASIVAAGSATFAAPVGPSRVARRVHAGSRSGLARPFTAMQGDEGRRHLADVKRTVAPEPRPVERTTRRFGGGFDRKTHRGDGSSSSRAGQDGATDREAPYRGGGEMTGGHDRAGGADVGEPTQTGTTTGPAGSDDWVAGSPGGDETREEHRERAQASSTSTDTHDGNESAGSATGSDH